MRLTEALLRNIIREEIKNTISSLEEGLYHASTTRAKKDFVGSVTRGLSSFGLGTKTKE